ncbi:MAG: hydrogenase [Deltaproteobacteria bacterium]|nr:hydrogenase [Deltaproteobacteria bacterium]
MIPLVDSLLALVFLTVLFSLNCHRLLGLIRIMAIQGIIVSLIPFLLEKPEGTLLVNVGVLLVIVIVKGLIIPGMLLFAIRKVQIRKEVEPIISYNASIFIGLLVIYVSVLISGRMHLTALSSYPLLLPAAFTALAAGLFLLMARRKAITQIIGYLMMENGIYLAGAVLAKHARTQHIVEFGILLDLLVGVMIMGIILHRINHSYDDADTTFLEQLKD